jgi:hypothetical protein
MAAIAAINQRLDGLTERPTPPTANVPGELILYYTSKDHPGCKAADESIAKIRAAGWPVVITTLAPRDAEVQGVPRVYLPYENRHITGASNIVVFLAGLTPR